MLLSACSGGSTRDDPAQDNAESTVDPDTTATRDSAPDPSPVLEPVSVPGLWASVHRGDRLRLGAVREQTAAYTAYDVTFRSRTTGSDGDRSLRISGVLAVPDGDGPFPAVVLAHGYIDPRVYVQGQGMTRERGRLAAAGYVALHVDYRNHAASDDDPRSLPAVRLGYTSDVINAVKALQSSTHVAVDPDRIALFGRSMGGGVVLRALAVEPDLVRAGVAWASVSSLEAENFRHFQVGDPAERAEIERVRREHGLPGEAKAFWRGVSPRPYFDLVEAPVLLAHGRFDDTCPPQWARATQAALSAAGVDSRLRWYDDGHAFGPEFDSAMADTLRFLQEAGV